MSDSPNNITVDSISKPVPKWIKFGLPIFFVCLLGVGLTLAISFLNDSDVVASAGDSLEISDDLIDGDGFSVLDEDGRMSPGIDPDITKNTLSKSVNHVSIEEFDKLKGDYEALNNMFSDSNALLNAYKSKFGDINSHLFNIKDKTIPKLRRSDEVLKKKISELSSKLNEHDKKLLEKEKAKRRKPPFSLLSIDRWDVVTSAVIGFDGKIAIASVGDVRAGWKIDSFVLPDCIYTIQLEDESKVKLCAN